MDAATSLTLQTKMERPPVVFDQRDMLVEVLDEFARCIRGETMPETDTAVGLNALQVILGPISWHQSGQGIAL